MAESSGPSTKKLPAQSRLCFKCSSIEHRVKDCPSVAPGDAEKLNHEWRERKRAAAISSINALGGMEQASACAAAVIEETVTVEEVLLDTGADTTVVSRGLVRELKRSGVQLRLNKGDPHVLRPFGSKPIRTAWHIIFDKVQLTTVAGPLMLRQLRAWVHEGERETSSLILYRFVMRRLGYSVDALLAEAREQQKEFDLEKMETGPETSDDDKMLTATPELLMPPPDDDPQKSLKPSEKIVTGNNSCGCNIYSKDIMTCSAFRFDGILQFELHLSGCRYAKARHR
ncbi:hypothetical protein PHMEG_00011217 [Phytophthora megakarya]|uniref:Peptidase A2 domain-containing protein n=1 Tax=Phytophthora megakarya TaxID=4795 RepID=A0A225WCR6_9STRA|nr:hypothetical protein PHMEG_00011217 [Phytophthora megakarya]